MSTKDGGPAFPVIDHDGQGFSGASLRDYFAAAALSGMHGWPQGWFTGDITKGNYILNSLGATQWVSVTGWAVLVLALCCIVMEWHKSEISRVLIFPLFGGLEIRNAEKEFRYVTNRKHVPIGNGSVDIDPLVVSSNGLGSAGIDRYLSPSIVDTPRMNYGFDVLKFALGKAVRDCPFMAKDMYSRGNGHAARWSLPRILYLYGNEKPRFIDRRTMACNRYVGPQFLFGGIFRVIDQLRSRSPQFLRVVNQQGGNNENGGGESDKQCIVVTVKPTPEINHSVSKSEENRSAQKGAIVLFGIPILLIVAYLIINAPFQKRNKDGTNKSDE